MKVLVACEFSGVVRDAFRKLGHDAWSIDLLPSESDSRWHWQQDVLMHFKACNNPWDMIIAFPPCTHLCVSGARWFKDKQVQQREAIGFFMAMTKAPSTRIAIENPIGIMSTHYRKPDQIIQPWQFGHGETKATCLWLKGLPKLVPSNIVDGREARIHKMGPSANRSRERSRTFQGIANAMASQWNFD